MNRPDPFLIASIQAYRDRFPGEQATAGRFLEKVSLEPDCLYRDNRAGHLTASAWVLDASGTRVLLMHHRKLNRWLQPGGHADGDPDLQAVARREVEEETGLADLSLSESGIFDLDIHRIPARGDFAEHDHFDVRFLFKAPESAQLVANHESYEVAWVSLDLTEPRLQEASLARMVSKSI